LSIEHFLASVAVYALPVIFAITLHEAAHGYVAKHFGDRTAYMLGRITLNPVKHIDPMGTIVVPLATLLFAGFMFGWAKPVPVNERNLRSPKRDMLWVAAAGPGANLAMAIAWALLAKALTFFPESGISAYWVAVANAGIVINAIIGIFNLIPLLPLDGGRILASLLPDKLSYSYSRMEPYGLIIVVILMVTPLFGWLLLPLVDGAVTTIHSLFGLT
jgi:Zn-dependent protease